MKRFSLALLVLFLLFGLLPCAGAQTRIMVASDLHYLSPSLFEKDNPYFLKAVATGAGKATMNSAELLEGLLAEARHQQPDLLLLTGDLTFNGEAVSHQELAQALRALQAEGIPILVIPGNHDINNENAVRFTDDGLEWVDNVSSDGFARCWAGMLAEEMTGPGFSGVVRLSDRVWVAAGDYSVYEDRLEAHGSATDAHLQWMSEVMAAAQAGATVVSASHQTLRSHTEYSAHTFRVIGGEKIAALLSEGGCRLNLCGHMHTQHILPGEPLTDIATGSFCVPPHRYGIVTVEEDGSLGYDAFSVCPEHLPVGLCEETREFFRSTMYKGLRVELMAMGVFDQKLIDMVGFAMDVNEYYFAGTLSEHPEVFADPARALWKQYERSSSFAHYLTLLLGEEITDDLHWRSAP